MGGQLLTGKSPKLYCSVGRLLLTNSLKFPVYDALLKDSEQVMRI